MGYCRDCKHWGAPDIPSRDFADASTTGPVRSCMAIAEGVDASCDCSYQYSGDVHFYTDADFGCVRFEAK